MLVTHSFISFIVILGICIGSMAMLAVYLLFLSRPAIENDAPVSDRIRHRAGLFMLSLLVTFLYWVPIVISDAEDLPFANFYYHLGIQLDLLIIVPFFFSWLFSLLQEHPGTKLIVRRWSLIIFPIGFLIAFLITKNTYITAVVTSLWIIYSIIAITQFVVRLGIYHRKLRQTYTDLTNRSLYWLYGMAAMAVAELVLYLLTYFRDTILPQLLAVQDVFTVLLGVYITYFVDRQSLLTISDGKLLDTTSEEQDEKPSASDAPVAVDNSERILDIEAKLKRLCEEQQCYTNPALDASMLARIIGTNRTYLSEYFSARGTTFYGYINALRINYACRLMDSGNRLSIAELAIQCGYNNVNTFRRVFVERMGYTPSQYVPQNTTDVS